MQDTSKPTQPRWGAQRVMAWVALLYFSEGLPLGLFYDLFPVNLRQAGVSPAEIGLLSLIGLAWTVKFLWAPLVDAWRGHRWWIAGANWGMAATLVALVLNPQALGQGATWPWVLLALLGTTLIIGSANAINMYLEREIDGRVPRTRSRPRRRPRARRRARSAGRASGR